MSQLDTTNIGTSLVGTTLGIATREVDELCTDSSINKWSKYKPVVGIYPQGGDGKYGLDYSNLWVYLQPSSNYRLGDFRRYEHDEANTLPPAYVVYATSSFGIHGSAYDPVLNSLIFGTLTLNDNGIAGDSEISLVNLGLNGYYFGMYIKQQSHGIYRWKTLSAVASNAQLMTADLFDDFPTGIVQDGSATEVQFILASAAQTTWVNTMSGVTWFRLPHETVNSVLMTSLQAFTFSLYITVDPTSVPLFPASSYSEYQLMAVTTNINADTDIGGWEVLSQPSWIDIRVWNDNDFREEPTPWYGTEDLLLYSIPNSNNTGAYRSGNIVLADSSSNSLCTIPVYQSGGPASATIEVCAYGGGWTISSESATATTGSPTVNISYIPSGFSATPAQVFITIRKGSLAGDLMALDSSHTSRDGYSSTFNITMSENAIGGETYKVYLSSAGECETL